MNRIFLIEDEAIMREMLSMLFARTNDLTIVGQAASGEEALGIWNEDDVDLTVLDLSLPGISGVDVLRELKRRAPDAPVLVVSGSHKISDVKEARSAGADGFIIKGDPQKIVVAIRTILNGEPYFEVLSPH